MTYAESIEWLFSTQFFGIKLGLDGPRRLLKEYLAFPAHGVKVLHVAGTNGKGSTCAIADSIVRAAGRRTGLFTSPHLIDFRERIQVSGKQIPEDACAAMLTELREICSTFDPHPTFFEIALALAMRWFRERDCEWIILETGMGGRLDATTAVPADVCVITPIGLDHCEWLGDTLAAIAREKAGIFLPGVPAISAPQHSEAAAALEKEANQTRTPLEFITEPLQGYGISLPGEHQAWNAALAVHALHRAGLRLNSDIVRHGLSHVSWPGRFERIAENIILDGAHNPHAAETLAATWRSEYPDIRPALVFSAVEGKDVPAILAHLAPLAGSIHLCPVSTPRAMAVDQLAGCLPPGSPAPTLHAAFPDALTEAHKSGGKILVAGSLFLIGEARALLTNGEFQSSLQ